MIGFVEANITLATILGAFLVGIMSGSGLYQVYVAMKRREADWRTLAQFYTVLLPLLLFFYVILLYPVHFALVLVKVSVPSLLAGVVYAVQSEGW